MSIENANSFDTAASRILDELKTMRRRRTYARDVVGRYPALRQAPDRALPRLWPVRIAIGSADDSVGLSIAIAPDGSVVTWHREGGGAAALVRQFHVFMEEVANDGEQALGSIPLLTDEERQRVLVTWNDTERPYDRDVCIHQRFEVQAARTPFATAVVFEGEALDYATLNARANRVAWRLRMLGVGPDVVVGLATERSLDMVVGVLGILKAGGAYLPLDPTYPRSRLQLMMEDAQVPVVLTHERIVATLPGTSAHVLAMDSDEERRKLSSLSESNPPGTATGASLAYLIYTSGSTGTPKGVMIEHRNVANFLAGMDECVRYDPPGVWLAVTSLSFDISVLEIFWTLAHGFKVVIQGDQRQAITTASRSAVSRRPIQMSLSYFASDERQSGGNKYRLLLEGAKFADRHGFTAVWTPERHFHAFGGLYPNPSVISAAIAAVTSRVGIRAGSVVLPLHHPIRVAEEWSLVDNLSGGRIGVSFASGWHPDDFVLRPEAFADAKERMFKDVDVVRRLWRGERVAFPGPLGKPVETATLPRPIQPALPVWITTAGNPETFRAAGEAGAFVLTHLLGQTTEELAEKIEVYRTAWHDAGHGPGNGHVTLMLHTFVGDSDSSVRDMVRGPMKEYLRSSVNLIKQYGWSFPAFKKVTSAQGTGTGDLFGQLSAEDMDALLEHAFDRYFQSGGLFGTPDTCVATIDRLKALGIGEVACLIDFGVDEDTVLRHLEHLDRLRQLVSAAEAPADDDYSVAAEIERHGVTHFQCTPSLASALLHDAGTRLALGSLDHMLVGGEALSPILARGLRSVVRGTVTNMYGPTETTVWSATAAIAAPGTVTIGRPIANTQIYVLDAAMQPAPPGSAGEIYIGGDGVARGYLRRPELTSEWFVDDPFTSRVGARLYRTGDLGRHVPDGQLEFLGRIDHQIKILGHRIELGEIESTLLGHPSVQDAVVVAIAAPDGSKRLAAYTTPRSGLTIETTVLRAYVSERLPEYMIPSHFVVRDKLPLTPNGKIDRKALPSPEVTHEAPSAISQSRSDLEAVVAGVWQGVLLIPSVGLDQNFFHLGGNSLLTLQVLARLRDLTGKGMPITDMFRFPTVRSFAAHLSSPTGAPEPGLAASQERAASRREMMSRRRDTRMRPSGQPGTPAGLR